MHYTTQETHDLHHSGNTCTTSQNITQYTHYYTVKVDISSQDKHIPKIAKLTRKGPKYINTSLEKMNWSQRYIIGNRLTDTSMILTVF